MKTVNIPFGSEQANIRLPDETEILSMPSPQPLADPAAAIQHALTHSIGSPGLETIIKEKLRAKPNSTAVIVLSDQTRPVPYSGANGILVPIVETLRRRGIPQERLLILIATGTHHTLTQAELERLLDPRIFEMGIPITSHDCRDKANLMYLGRTRRGSEVYINRDYLTADIKIATGLVESHFMAGVSGGRKSICPGLVGEETTYIFHSAAMVAAENSRDLQLDGNPCHEEALEVARKAGVDYIVNVTLDTQYKLTGVFAGDLEQAHVQAFEHLKSYVTIPLRQTYDLVVTHAGFVGINHYQAIKAALVAMPAVKDGGNLILAAANTDRDPVGSQRYRTLLHLLKMIGAEKYLRLIFSPDWAFIPDQWEVQEWAKLFLTVPVDHFIYYSPYLSEQDYAMIPGVNGNDFLPPETRYARSIENVADVVERSLSEACENLKRNGKTSPTIAFLADGPYGIITR